MNKDKNKMASWCVVVLTAALISTFVLVAPVNAGGSPDVGRSVGNITNGTIAIIGETNLSFVNATGALIPEGYLINAEDSSIFFKFNKTFNSKEENPPKGLYKVTNTMFEVKTNISFALPILDVFTKVSGETDFSDDPKTVTQGINITFKANTNLDAIKGSSPNNITYKLIDPNGLQRRRVNGKSLMDIDVSDNGTNYLTINTSNLDELGEYTLSIETDPDTNNGLDKEGSSISFTIVRVVKEEGITYITIGATPGEQNINDKVVISASTTPNTNVTLNVTSGNALCVVFRDDRGDVEVGGHSASGKSDKNGDFKAAVYFNDTGSYEITATELEHNTTDSVTVQIVGFEAEVKTDKSIYYIGEDITISGSTNGGTEVTIKVGNEVLVAGVPIEGEKFSYTWKRTEEKSPGLYKIEMWVLPQSDTETDLPDDSVTIMLLRGGLSAKTSTEFVARGDGFTIEGTVPGRDYVDILTIAPKGGGGKGLDSNDISTETDGNLSAPGLTHYTSGVTSEKFKKDKIKVSLDADTGTYLIAVLNYGRDKKWGTSGNDNLLEVISNDYTTSLAAKTPDQILAILKDKTINVAGSDDLLCIATIKVENGFVTLNKIEDVHLGKNIEVTGTTNRKVGAYVIVTVEGLEDNAVKLKPKFVEVKGDDTIFYNKFSVSLATATAKIGKYEVTADDGDGHMDTTTVNIVPAAAPSVNVSSSTPTADQAHGTNESANATLQMAMSTPTSTQTETKIMPGFGTIFTITVVLAVSRLLRSVRHRQRKSVS
ncbi:hypothetical protein ES705_06330 [subsurface metagenome]|nr:hypothetical protein [Methanosarcinales archaeon]